MGFMKYFGIIPLIGFVVLFYNLLVVIKVGFGPAGTLDGMAMILADPLFRIPMVSGEHLQVTGGDLFIFFGLLMLIPELLRSTKIGHTAIVNHWLSMALFIVALIEFLLLKGFATATFLLLIFMQGIDVLAGFSIGLVAARRDIGVGKDLLNH